MIEEGEFPDGYDLSGQNTDGENDYPLVNVSGDFGGDLEEDGDNLPNVRVAPVGHRTTNVDRRS